MENYLKGNDAYWQQGYEGENVESFVFRVYGRILKHELGLSGRRNAKSPRTIRRFGRISNSNSSILKVTKAA